MKITFRQSQHPKLHGFLAFHARRESSATTRAMGRTISHSYTYLGTPLRELATLSKLTGGTPSSFGMAMRLCTASAPQATTHDTMAVVVHSGGGLRMRKSLKLKSWSASSADASSVGEALVRLGSGRGMM